MDSAFSRALSEHYCPYSAAHARFHPARLRHALPLLFYPRGAESRLCDVSCPAVAAPLVPLHVPLHGRFGVYECALEPAFIQKRNERERQRVRCVNQGYAKLREHLPGAATDKRMSKAETLRAAIRYIKHLQRLAEEREITAEEREPPAEEREITAEEREPPAEEREPPAEEREPPAEEREVPAEEREPPAEEREVPAEEREPPAEEREVPAEEREPPAAEARKETQD